MSNSALKGDVWSSKLQSFVVIEDRKADQEIIKDDNAILVLRSDGKNQNFFYDSAVDEGSRDQLLSKLKKSIHLVRLGFNSSVYINGNSKNQQDSIESMIVKEEIQQLYLGFESDEKNHENGIQSSGETLLFWSVKFSCYELFDGHIVDLSCQKCDEATNSKTNLIRKGAQEPKVVHGAVTNVAKESCPTAESAIAFVTRALLMRQFLFIGTALGPYDGKAPDVAKPPPSPARLVGAIGSLFILMNIEQLVYVVASGETKTVESTLEFVFLCSGDVLSCKPDKYEGIQSIRLIDSTPNHIISGSSDEIKMKNNKLLVSLQTGLQSLSALTRVVNGLSGGLVISENGPLNSSTKAVTVGSTQTQKPQNHIPFRDSLLTRLLQKSLCGNCSVFMVTIVNGASEGLIKNLRFAAEIRNISNKMWSNYTLGTSATCSINAEKILVMTQAFMEKVNFEIEQNAKNTKKKPHTRSSMAAFNDVLKDFHDSLLELAEFSANFYQNEAQQKREAQLLSGLGIKPSHTPPVTVQDYGDDEIIEVVGASKSTATLPILTIMSNNNLINPDNDTIPSDSNRESVIKESVWGDTITGRKELPTSTKSLPKLSRMAPTDSNNNFKSSNDGNSSKTDSKCATLIINDEGVLRIPSPNLNSQSSERYDKRSQKINSRHSEEIIRHELPSLNIIRNSSSSSPVSSFTPINKNQNQSGNRSLYTTDGSLSPDPSSGKYKNNRSGNGTGTSTPTQIGPYSAGSNRNDGMLKISRSLDMSYRMTPSTTDTPSCVAEECVTPSAVMSALNSDDTNKNTEYCDILNHLNSGGDLNDAPDKSLGAILYRKLSEHHHIQSLNGYVSNQVEGWVADINTNKSATGSPVTPAPFSLDKVQRMLDEGMMTARDSDILPTLGSFSSKNNNNNNDIGNRQDKKGIQSNSFLILGKTRDNSPTMVKERNRSAEGSSRARNRSAGGNSPVQGTDPTSGSRPRSSLGQNRSGRESGSVSGSGSKLRSDIGAQTSGRNRSAGDQQGQVRSKNNINRSLSPYGRSAVGDRSKNGVKTDQTLNGATIGDTHECGSSSASDLEKISIDQLNLDASIGQDEDRVKNSASTLLPSLFKKKIPSYNIMDDQDDGLSLPERKFLKAVSQNNVTTVEEFLREKGNCNVINGFGR